MLMIGITGVTGKLGFYVANLVDKRGMASIHLARSPERATVYTTAEIRKMVYANTPEVVEALKGIDAWVSTYTAIKVGEQAGVSTDVENVLGHPATSLLDILRDRQLIEEEQ